VRVSASSSGVFSGVSGNRRLPLPSTTGKIISRYSSMTPCGISDCTSVQLPATRIGPPSACLSFATSAATSPPSTVVFSHSGSRSVVEATNFGIAFILSANSPERCGQAAEKPSYVTRPSSSASASRTSSSLYASCSLLM
jgi:hypothetical protein